MDVWQKIEELKAALGLSSDSALARRLGSRFTGREHLSAGYFWNLRNGVHGPSRDVVVQLSDLMEAEGILRSATEVLQFRDALQAVKPPNNTNMGACRVPSHAQKEAV